MSENYNLNSIKRIINYIRNSVIFVVLLIKFYNCVCRWNKQTLFTSSASHLQNSPLCFPVLVVLPIQNALAERAPLVRKRTLY